MKILEDCDLDVLDEKYEYWNRTLNRNLKEEMKEESKLFHFKNPKTGYTITSIYSDLKQCENYIKDWEDYERYE